MPTNAMQRRSFGELHTLTVPELTTAEQFIVGSCRCWDVFLDSPDRSLAWRELAPVFAYMDVLSALCAFDRTFEALRRHQLRAFAFNDVDSALLGPDEARLLSALACLQRGDARATVTALKGTLSHHGVHAVLPPLARIASILDARGHRLPSWRDTPVRQSSEAHAGGNEASRRYGNEFVDRGSAMWKPCA